MKQEYSGYFTNVDITRMVVHGQLVEPTVCLSDLYDVFLLDIVRDIIRCLSVRYCQRYKTKSLDHDI